MKTNKYNPEVDMWKFFFAVVVALHHTKKLNVVDSYSIFSKGHIAVEFFLIVSGYFMAANIRRQADKGVSISTRKFLINKFKPIYPYFVSSILIYFIVVQCITRSSLIDGIKNFFLSVYQILLLGSGGIATGARLNNPTWYLSSMLLVMAFLYPIACKWKQEFFMGGVGAPLLSVFCYAIIYQTGNTINITYVWHHITYLCTYRTIAGLCLGIFCNELVYRIKLNPYKPTKAGNVIFLLIEIIIGVLIICYMHFAECLELNYNFGYVTILLLFALVFMIFSELSGVAQKIKNPELFKPLSKLSLLIYLNHFVMITLLNSLKLPWSYRHHLFYFVLGTIGSMIVCYLGVTIVWSIRKKVEKYIFDYLFTENKESKKA